MGWRAKYYEHVADAAEEAQTDGIMEFNNLELLLIEDALNIAQRESGKYMLFGDLLYKKVRGHLESQGYRFNEDGSYYHITRG